MNDLIGKIRRGIRKPPKVIIARIAAELCAESEFFVAPLKRKMPLSRILRRTGCNSLEQLWSELAKKPFIANVDPIDAAEYERYFPGDRHRILEQAKLAMNHTVDLLGTGPTYLGSPIQWNIDFKVGKIWPNQFYRRIDYVNKNEPSDVKIPWEVSRLQWAIPLGQAYLLTGDEIYADQVKQIISSWCKSNPYAGSVNWSCTMEVALRIFVFIWFFYVFNKSSSWNDRSFRIEFLKNLYLHSEFTELHIERSHINGNHFTADAAALVASGIFWGITAENRIAQRWLEDGWKDLLAEIQLQVTADGCDYEASIAYHRLVAELFLAAAIYRKRNHLPVENQFLQRLLLMGEFTRAYLPCNGLAPLLGDADDARVLPFGGQAIGDHHYLPDLIASEFSDDSQFQKKNSAEIFWVNRRITANIENHPPLSSKSFPHGGYYIIRDKDSHVFIDCAPLGLADTGGHGHNDALSFELVLLNNKIFSDSGAFVYTASFSERNLFRSTAYHNVPRLDNREINRFVRDDYLWSLHNDARPKCLDWSETSNETRFIGEHYGYVQSFGLYSRRMIKFEVNRIVFSLIDGFIAVEPSNTASPTEIEVTYQLILDSQVKIVQTYKDYCIVQVKGQIYIVKWVGHEKIGLTIHPARISPSYGVLLSSNKLVWSAKITRDDLVSNPLCIMVYCDLDESKQFVSDSKDLVAEYQKLCRAQ